MSEQVKEPIVWSSPWPGIDVMAGELLLVVAAEELEDKVVGVEEFAFAFGMHAMKSQEAKLLIISDPGDDEVIDRAATVLSGVPYECGLDDDTDQGLTEEEETRYREAVDKIVRGIGLAVREAEHVWSPKDTTAEEKSVLSKSKAFKADMKCSGTSRLNIYSYIDRGVDEVAPDIVIITDYCLTKFYARPRREIGRLKELRKLAIEKNVAIIACRPLGITGWSALSCSAPEACKADVIIQLYPVVEPPKFEAKLVSRRAHGISLQYRVNPNRIVNSQEDSVDPMNYGKAGRFELIKIS